MFPAVRSNAIPPNAVPNELFVISMLTKPISVVRILSDLIAEALLLLPIGCLTTRMWQSGSPPATPDTIS